MTLTYVTLPSEWVKIISILITLAKFFLPSCTQFPSGPSSLGFPFYHTPSRLILFILLWGWKKKKKKGWKFVLLKVLFLIYIYFKTHMHIYIPLPHPSWRHGVWLRGLFVPWISRKDSTLGLSLTRCVLEFKHLCGLIKFDAASVLKGGACK